MGDLIKPSGFYKSKSQYLFDLDRFVFKNYGSLAKMGKQELFEKDLRRDFRLYQDFHALIVIDGKNQN